MPDHSDPHAVLASEPQAASSLSNSTAARDALCDEAERYVARGALMIQRARLLVQADRKKSLRLLISRRTALCAHFQRYQRFKHGQIFDPVVQHGPPSSKVVARTMKLDCMALGEQFATYHTRWIALSTLDWSDYRDDMLATTNSLLGHLDAELRAMRQLLMIADLYRM